MFKLIETSEGYEDLLGSRYPFAFFSNGIGFGELTMQPFMVMTDGIAHLSLDKGLNCILKIAMNQASEIVVHTLLNNRFLFRKV